MENNAHSCKLLWGQGLFSKTIPFDDATNTPILSMSPLTSSYRAFVHTFQALEAPFFSREHVHQLPGRRWLDRGSPPDPAEFVTEENFDFSSMPHSEGDKANKRSRSPLETVQGGSPLSVVVRNDLRYDSLPLLTEEDEYCVAAPDDQAELMRWHYRLGHKPFARLETKVPWRRKGRHNSTHPVFAATKPGECVSVDHMQSTAPGFYGQSKGILTKTRYRNATTFVDHYSRLKFVY
jgi:hypothetical protein